LLRIGGKRRAGRRAAEEHRLFDHLGDGEHKEAPIFTGTLSPLS
jgi:hypothetical protein